MGRREKMEDNLKDNLKEYQEYLLKMLLAFDAFCREQKLQYFLAGGSALGAVRHQGFIPWDDDIDLAMLRPDFERLERLLAQQDNRIGQYAYSPVQDQIVPDAPIGHLFYLPGADAKNDPKHAHLPYAMADAPMLDIHPIDGIPKSGIMKKLQRFLAIVHYMAVYRLPTKNKGRAAHLISGILVKITPGFMFDFYATVSRRLISAWNADRSEFVCSLFGLAGYDREVMRKELLLPYKMVPFEGHMLPVPAREREYLDRLYGNFEQLPPEADRKPKHTGYRRFMEALHAADRDAATGN